MLKTNKILIMIACVCFFVFGFVFSLFLIQGFNQEEQKEVLSYAMVDATDEDGFFVFLDPNSQFGGIRIRINYTDEIPLTMKGEQLAIYHNGVLIDATPIRFQKIIRIEKTKKIEIQEEQKEELLYSDWIYKNILFEDLEEELQNMIHKAVQNSKMNNSFDIEPLQLLCQTDDVFVVLCKSTAIETKIESYKTLYMKKNAEILDIILERDIIVEYTEIRGN